MSSLITSSGDWATFSAGAVAGVAAGEGKRILVYVSDIGAYHSFYMFFYQRYVTQDMTAVVTCTFENAEGNLVEGVYGQNRMERFCARAFVGGGNYYEYIITFCNAAYNHFH